MSFKHQFLTRVADQAAKTATQVPAVEQIETAPAISETAPATEVVEVVEEVPAVEPQPEPQVQPVKAEVPAKAAPQLQPQQQQPKLNAPAKGKRSVLVSDLKSLPEKLELTIVGPVSTLRYIELDENEYHVEEMKAVTAMGKLSIVATTDLQARIVQSYKNGVTPFVEIVKRTTSKGEPFYQVKTVIEGVQGINSIGGKIFKSAEQIFQWVINGLTKEGMEVSPAIVAKAYNSIKLINVNEGIVVVNAREIEHKFTVVTVPAALNIANTTVPATTATATVTATNLPTATATNAAALNTANVATTGSATATTNATNVTRK